MPTITDWIQASSTVILVAVTIVYVWKTASIARANREAVDAMRAQTDAILRPYVTITPLWRRKSLLEIEISNKGLTSAQNLKLTISPHFAPNNLKSSWTAGMHAFTQEIASFPSGSRLLFPVGSPEKITDSVNVDQEQPNVITVTASYLNGTVPVTEKMVLDFRMFKGMIIEAPGEADALTRIASILTGMAYR